MKKYHAFLTLTALFMISIPAFSQDTDFKNLFSGNRYPLTYKLKDLDSTWYRFEVTNAGDMGVFMSLISGGATGLFNNINYSAGDITTITGEQFLVCYSPQSKPISFRAMDRPSRNVKPESLSEETVLTLSLVNIKNIQKISAITPFDIQAEIKRSRIFSGEDEISKQKELSDESKNNLKQLAIGFIMYCDDFNGKMPSTTDPDKLKSTLTRYLKDSKVFISPRTERQYSFNNFLRGKSRNSIKNPSATPLFYEDSDDLEGSRCVAFLDGHVRNMSGSEFYRMLGATGTPASAAVPPLPKPPPKPKRRKK